MADAHKRGDNASQAAPVEMRHRASDGIPYEMSQSAVQSSAEAPPPLDIAVVGMSCLLPGATDLVSYWRNIIEQRDVLSDIPPDRFEWRRWFDEDRKARDKIYSHWGGFLPDVPFDPLKYGIPPATLKSIEPMQLLALVLVDQVLNDAGYAEQNPFKERTSVIFGAGGGIAELGAAYALRAMLPQVIENPDETLWSQLPEWTEDSFAGILMNVVAGRIANRFDFGGVNYTVDAACASSLSAIYLACRELSAGTSDLVISGGCDTLQSPFTYLCFGTAGALSPRGKSRTFDADSDGIAISEGLAAIALKRRADAERDGDRIYAVLRAVAGGSDGRSKGMTAPRPEGQLRTLQRAYEQARFSPATVGLFEAHGTGTRVGDQTECGALNSLLTEHGATRQNSAVGSVKSMMGHTKCTAGVAGVIKAALALHYRVLPPTMHVERPNPDAGLVDGSLYVNSQLRPWLRGEHPRRAGISSFGFGGTNFHAVLEEFENHQSAARIDAHRTRSAELFFFRGETASNLVDQAESLAAEINAAQQAGHTIDLPNLAFTWHRRQASAQGACRASIVSGDVAELLTQLNSLAAAIRSGGRLAAGVHYTETPLAVDRETAFLFPGQGSQYVDMLRDLAIEFAEVRRCFETADAVLAGEFEQPLSRYIFPPPAFDDETRSRQSAALKSTDVLQPALGACDWAMVQLLASFGVRPQMTAGHSYGELVALCAAGCIDEATLYRLSLARGRAITQLTSQGGQTDLGQMLAVRAAEFEVKEVLADCPEVWLANLNSPRQTIISGTRAGLAQATELLHQARLAATPIPVDCAFHSPLMDPARERFAEVLDQVELAAPRLPVFGNTHATPYPDEPREIRRTLAEHLTGQVQFASQIEAMFGDGSTIFVEVGPNRVLSKLTADILSDQPHLAVATQLPQGNGFVQFLGALAELFAHGLAVDDARLYVGREVESIDLGEMARTAPPKLPAHVWLVNGGYARPSSEPPRRMQPRARLASAPSTAEPTPSAASSAPQQSLPAAQPALPVSAAPRETATDRPAARADRPAPPDGSDDVSVTKASEMEASDAQVPQTSSSQPTAAEPAALPPAHQPALGDQAMAEFQQTMRMFLQTQEAVMAAYLGGAPATSSAEQLAAASSIASPATASPAAATPATPSPVASSPAPQPVTPPAAPAVAPSPVEREPVPEPVAATPTPTVQASPEPAGQPVDGLGDLLVEIVSDRTGYPSDMLALDANLEADLGIDSIKRVEIIGAFRRAAVPNMQEPPEWFMERVSGAGTLQEILDGVSELAGQTDEPAAMPAAAEASPAVAPAAFEQMLVDVVSDRTGYPSDMLTLDANLEADLGIDSIKRVEIIGAFRRVAVPQLEEPPAWFMERVSGAGTLRDILDGVSELAASDESPAPAAAPVVETFTPPVDDVATTTTESSSGFEKMLVDVVSDRTGYPSDMLTLDANLEADLGIDSIKRVEIIGAFRRVAVPQLEEPPEWFMERISSAGTLQEILDGVSELAGHDEPVATQPLPAAAPSTPASPPVEKSTRDDGSLEQVLVGVVSDRTGYPAEMLDLEANLEADLGIDSIKRVEIIGAFRRAAVPGVDEPPEWFMEKMSSAQTMRTILDGVLELVDGAATVRPPAIAATNGHSPTRMKSAAAIEGCPRCVATAVECPLDGSPLRLPEGALLITDDGHGVAQQVLAAIERAGGRATIVAPDDVAGGEQAVAVVGRMRSTGPLGGLIHLAGLAAAPDFPEIDQLQWQQHFQREVRSLLFLCQALAPELSAARDGSFWLGAVTTGGGDFDTSASDEGRHAWRGGITGFLKVAAKEWTGARVRALDVEETASGDALLLDLAAAGPVEVGYRRGRRLAIEPRRAELDRTTNGTSFPWDAKSVVLVTGGARGITAQISQELAQASGATFVLLGRSAAPPAVEDIETASIREPAELRQKLIAQLRASGAAVTPKEVERRLRRLLADREIRQTFESIRAVGGRAEYIACDVRDEAALGQVIEQCIQRFGKIDAVVHGAGVIDDKYIVDKSAESFDGVVGTKLDPMLTLVQRLDASRLKSLILFSSVAGFFGNAGQCDYAVANETLNRVARRLRDLWPGRVVALNWGPWSGAGMVTPEVARQFESRGVGMIPVAAGRRVVVDELMHGHDDEHCLLLGPGPWLDDADRLATSGSSVQAETPLLSAQRVSRPSDGTAEAHVVLDGVDWSLLRDHKIDENPVLPAAVAVELMAETAAAAAPAGWHVTHVENVRMFAGVVLQERRFEIDLRAEPLERDPQEGRWRVRLNSSAGGRTRPHYEVIVRLAAEVPPPPAAPELRRIDEPFPLHTVDEAYRRWLFHGPTFQAIQELRGLNASGVDAIVKPSCPRQCLGLKDTRGWLIDPVVLDVCPQLAMLWSRAVYDTSPLPNRIAVYHRYAPLGEEPVEALFRVDASTGENAYRADVWLIRAGHVVGLMEGLEGAGSAELNRIAGSSSR